MSVATHDIPLQEDVLCPLCGYNLRGLVEARCPECGAQFDFNELRDPARRKHPYLFEHHPEQNLRSFVRTMIGLCWPWKFWKDLQPIQPSFPRRIVLYWVAVVAICLSLIVLRYIADIVEVKAQLNVQRPWTVGSLTTAYKSDPRWKSVIAPYGSVQSYVDAHWPVPGTPGFYLAAAGLTPQIASLGVPHAVQLLEIVAIALIWPWLTVLVFMIFRMSMRRARIRTQHMMRIAIYNGDVIIWAMLLLAPAVVLRAMSPLAGVTMMRAAPGMSGALLLAKMAPFLACLVYAIRLWIACRRYLRFPHALATVISVQIIVLLLIPSTFVVIGSILHLLGIV